MTEEIKGSPVRGNIHVQGIALKNARVRTVQADRAAVKAAQDAYKKGRDQK